MPQSSIKFPSPPGDSLAGGEEKVRIPSPSLAPCQVWGEAWVWKDLGAPPCLRTTMPLAHHPPRSSKGKVYHEGRGGWGP